MALLKFAVLGFLLGVLALCLLGCAPPIRCQTRRIQWTYWNEAHQPIATRLQPIRVCGR